MYDIVAEAMAKPTYGPSCLVHREHVQRLKKLFEMLEYVGFIVKREASRALKSGGRGTRYVLNLCNLIENENISYSRLTHEMVKRWISNEIQYAQIYKGGKLGEIELPEVSQSKDLAILHKEIQCLQKSNAYPYGLTEQKIKILCDAGYDTVQKLADAEDSDLRELDRIGKSWIQRIKSVIGQAIWM